MNGKPASGAMELRDFFSALRRRRSQVFAGFGVVLLAALLLALVLPPVYRSSATILIERQEVPPELVATTVTGYVQERLQAITQRVLTKEKLFEIATEIGMYDPADPEIDRGELLKALREGTVVETQDVQAISPESGNRAVATVSFTVSFDAPTPEQAQRGAEAVTRLYLDEERRARLAQAREVSGFLAGQAQLLSRELAGLEKELAKFKQENVSQLPEHADLNMRLLEQADEKLERSEERLRTLAERKMDLQSQLATTSRHANLMGEDGQPVAGPIEQLAALRAQYLAASATYAPGHPDLERLRKKIAVLEAETGGLDGSASLYAELANKRTELATLRERYSSSHPDIARLERAIESLEQELMEGRRAEGRPETAMPPTSAAFIRLQTDLNTVMTEIEAERSRRSQLRERRQELESRLFTTPAVERDYLRLSRDYENALNKYREVKDKQLKAQAAERLEEEQKAQRFLLISPPGLPSAPESPNRKAILLLGAVLAFGGGVGAGSIAEYFDRTVRGIRGVNSVFGAPPLATIPYVENGADVVHRRLSRTLIVLLLAVLLGAAAVGYRFYAESVAPVAAVTQGQNAGE